MPVLLNQLAEAVQRIWDGQCRERDREPAIRGTQENGTPLLMTLIPVITAQVRMASIAPGQCIFALLAEGIGHAPLLSAGLAEHLDICRLTRHAEFAQLQRCFTWDLPMHKV